MDMTGKKILITGGLGFIGSNLAHRCVQEGAEVTIYDSLDPNGGGNRYNIKGIENKVTLCYHDILNFDEISQRVVEQDLIVNCAASTSHPFSMREPLIDLDVNSKGVITLLEAVRRFHPEVRLIHLGTSTQLGPLQYRPADERHPEFPTDIYSANKCVSEKYVLIYAKAHQLRASVVRLANVVGPRAAIHSPEFTFNNYFVGLALQDKEITVFGEGKQKRNVLYVEDAIAAILAVAGCDELIGETCFAVSKEHLSVAEIATTITEVLGCGRVQFVPWPGQRAAIEIGDAILSSERIEKATGWQPKYSFRQALAETHAYYKDCVEQYIPGEPQA